MAANQIFRQLSLLRVKTVPEPTRLHLFIGAVLYYNSIPQLNTFALSLDRSEVVSVQNSVYIPGGLRLIIQNDFNAGVSTVDFSLIPNTSPDAFLSFYQTIIGSPGLDFSIGDVREYLLNT